MFLEILKSKIHRATVTDANLDYEGSITIDRTLMDAAGILLHEKVQVLDIHNGARLETYVIEGPRDSGIICLNGAAARLVMPKDLVIIIAYAQMTPEEAQQHHPTVIKVDLSNRILSKSHSN
ncbi:MAG TPA: aspartate 1-decarboxylase [Fibrobacteraceae bacterium]|nr:aspartate 1-decarboxylase [Fibrobacteraceae bacterium]